MGDLLILAEWRARLTPKAQPTTHDKLPDPVAGCVISEEFLPPPCNGCGQRIGHHLSCIWAGWGSP